VISPETAKTEISAEKIAYFSKQATQLPKEDLLAITEELLRLEEKIRYALVKEVAFEIGMLKIAQLKQRVQIEKIIQQLSEGKEVSASISPSISTEKKTLASLPPSEAEAEVRASDPELVPAIKEPPTQKTTVASSNMDAAQAWNEAQNIFKRERPMMTRAVEACTFESYETPNFTIRMEAEEISYAGLNNPRNWSLLQSLIQERMGADTQLKMNYIPVVREPDPINIPVPVSKPKPASRKEEKSESFDVKDFENDPLIQQALQEFEGRIVSVRTAQP
jgi:DNA polymerase III subunit gamma/tau